MTTITDDLIFHFNDLEGVVEAEIEISMLLKSFHWKYIVESPME